MTKRLLSYDPDTRITEWFEFNHADDTYSISTTQDTSHIIRSNEFLQNETDRGWSKSKDWRRAASIPLGEIIRWKQEEGFDIFDKNNAVALRRKLNDLDNYKLRTARWNL
jgi:hypothetical protein